MRGSAEKRTRDEPLSFAKTNMRRRGVQEHKKKCETGKRENDFSENFEK